MSLAFIFLITFLVMVYTRPYEVLPFLMGLKLTKVSGILALIFLFLENYRKGVVWREKSFRLFFYIIVLSVALLPISWWPGKSLDFLKSNYLKVFLVFFALLVVVNRSERLNTLIVTIFFSTTFVAMRIIKAYASGMVTYDLDGTRRVIGVGTLADSDPNHMSGVLAMALPMGLYLLYTRKDPFKRLFYLLSLLSIVAAAVFTGSRGGFFALAVGFLTFFFSLYRGRIGRFIVISALLGTITFAMMPAMYQERILSIFSERDYNFVDVRGGRLAIWKRGINAMIAHPQGVGIKNYTLAEAEERRKMGITGRWMVAHNSFIQVGVELGLIGLLLYILFLRSGFTNLKRAQGLAMQRGDRNAILCIYAVRSSLMAFLVSSFFLSQAYYWSLYIFTALTAIIKFTLQKEERRIHDGQDQPALRVA